MKSHAIVPAADVGYGNAKVAFRNVSGTVTILLPSLTPAYQKRARATKCRGLLNILQTVAVKVTATAYEVEPPRASLSSGNVDVKRPFAENDCTTESDTAFFCGAFASPTSTRRNAGTWRARREVQQVSEAHRQWLSPFPVDHLRQILKPFA